MKQMIDKIYQDMEKNDYKYRAAETNFMNRLDFHEMHVLQQDIKAKQTSLGSIENDLYILKQKVIKEDKFQKICAFSLHVKLAKKVQVQMTMLTKVDKLIREILRTCLDKSILTDLVRSFCRYITLLYRTSIEMR